MKSICICEQGCVRRINQDCAVQFSEGTCGLYLVADGMGGHYAGEKASRAAAATFTLWWETYRMMPQRPNFVQVVNQLKEEIKQCHQKIQQFTPPGQICGTTLVLLWINDKQYALFSIGDSRCYQVRRRGMIPQVIQLTSDDIVRQEVMGNRKGNKLSRALGVGEKCLYAVQIGEISRHSIFALCTDGVYKVYPDKRWSKTLLRAIFGVSLHKTGMAISREVIKNGAPDNFSLVLIEV